MGKKKPFIDKKNSSTYHLIYRSQRDVAGDEDGGAPGVVLWPSPNNNKLMDQKILMATSKKPSQFEDSKPAATAGATLSQWKSQLTGLVDEYDYDQHMKPVSGYGQILTTTNTDAKEMNAMLQARNMDVRDEIVKEVDRQLESIALSAECMDPEIAEALFGEFEEGDFEELNDEYFLDAAKEPEVAETDQAKEDSGFDFASHVKMLMERARQEAKEGQEIAQGHEQGQQDKDFFSKAKPLQSVYEDLEEESIFGGVEYHGDGMIFENMGAAPKLSDAEEQALVDKFNATLLEYDSDEVGEGYDDEEAAGTRALEGDAQIEAALNEYLTDKNDEIFIQGNAGGNATKNTGSSGFSALVGTRMIPLKELEQDEKRIAELADAPPIAEVFAEANIVLSDPLAAPPQEDVLIDGKSYYSEKMRNPWDCESILSTYSNLDNNPATITAGGGRRRRRKGKKKGSSVGGGDVDDESIQQIKLSAKTGLPLGVLPEHGGADDLDEFASYMSVNKGEARKKKETAEEKKIRKQNVKVERQLARMQKKMMKEAFSEEFSKRTADVMSDDVGGKTVFRF